MSEALRFLNLEKFETAKNFISSFKVTNENCKLIQELDLLRSGKVKTLSVALEATLNEFSDMYHSLNVEQRTVFGIVISHLRGDEICKTKSNPKGQLRMFLSGAGGTGKTHVIRCLYSFCKMMFPVDESKYGPVVKLAPTGVAAHNIDGHTIESVFPLNFKDYGANSRCWQAVRMLQFRDEFQDVKLIIIDEFSMVGLSKLGKMNKLMSFVRSKEDMKSPHSIEEKVMGDVHVLFCGDLYQIGPVNDTPVYVGPYTSDRDAESRHILVEGYDIYCSINCFYDLKIQNRQLGDSDIAIRFRNSLNLQRVGCCGFADSELNLSRTIFSLEHPVVVNASFDAVYLAPTNDICRIINQHKLDLLEKSGAKRIHLWASLNVQNATETAGLQVMKNIYMTEARLLDKLKGFRPYLALSVGARVRITRNRAVSVGIYNGALGTVVGFLYSKDETCKADGRFYRPNCATMLDAISLQPILPIVLVKLDQELCGLNSYEMEYYMESNVVPISPETVVIRDKLLTNDKEVYMTQVPLDLAWCMSIHRCQGLSLSTGFLFVSNMFCRGLAYVARSRFRTFEGLMMIGSSSSLKYLTADEMNSFGDDTAEIRDEYACLNRDTTQHMECLTKHCQLYTLNDYIAVIFKDVKCVCFSSKLVEQMEEEYLKQCEMQNNKLGNELVCCSDDNPPQKKPRWRRTTGGY